MADDVLPIQHADDVNAFLLNSASMTVALCNNGRLYNCIDHCIAAGKAT